MSSKNKILTMIRLLRDLVRLRSAQQAGNRAILAPNWSRNILD